MSLRKSARCYRSLGASGIGLWGSAFSLLALAISGCVTGVLSEENKPMRAPGAGAGSAPADSGGQSGASVAAQAGAGSAGAHASSASGAPSSAGMPGVGGSGSTAGGPSAGSTNGGSSGVPGAGAAGMMGGAGAPAVVCPNKRGVAYAFTPNSAGPDMHALKSGVSWFYGWTTGPSAAAKPVMAGANQEFVPMIWNGSFKVADAVNSIPAGSKYLLGFNEPNFGKEANLTAQQAAELWPQVEQIAAMKQLQIVSPATNYCGGNCNQADPFVWLDDFFKACPNCKVDYIGVHWYACTLDALKNHVNQMKKYNKPLWLTEFACVDGGPWSVDQVKAYAVASTAWLEQESSVFRYSWFSGRTDIQNVSLLGNSGELTDVGKAYVNAPHHACP